MSRTGSRQAGRGKGANSIGAGPQMLAVLQLPLVIKKTPPPAGVTRQRVGPTSLGIAPPRSICPNPYPHP